MFNPTPNTTGSATLNHLITTFWSRTALDVLRKKTIFKMLTDSHILSRRNGKTIQFWRPTVFGVNTTNATEGSVDSPLQLTTGTVSATVGQYIDWLNFSDLLKDTALDDVLVTGGKEIGYRGALTDDSLIRNEFDSQQASTDVSMLGSFYSVDDLVHVRSLMSGTDVEPKNGPYFPGLAHPYVTFDLVRDPAAAGFVDIVKQGANTPGNERLFTFEDRGFVARIGGVELWESTNVTVSGASPNLKYRAYYSGKQGLATIDLEGRGPRRVSDPKVEQFNIISQTHGPDKSDPAGQIAGSVAYNFVDVAKTFDVNRLKSHEVPSSIVP